MFSHKIVTILDLCLYNLATKYNYSILKSLAIQADAAICIGHGFRKGVRIQITEYKSPLFFREKILKLNRTCFPCSKLSSVLRSASDARERREHEEILEKKEGSTVSSQHRIYLCDNSNPFQNRRYFPRFLTLYTC